MTRERAKALLPVIQAFAGGKTIQWKDCCGEWHDCTNDKSNFSFRDDGYEYRIKPSPKLRPWKPEEVPVGALIRNINLNKQFIVWMISGVAENNFYCAPPSNKEPVGLNDALKTLEHSLDNGKTWHPCGVEVSE